MSQTLYRVQVSQRMDNGDDQQWDSTVPAYLVLASSARRAALHAVDVTRATLSEWLDVMDEFAVTLTVAVTADVEEDAVEPPVIFEADVRTNTVVERAPAAPTTPRVEVLDGTTAPQTLENAYAVIEVGHPAGGAGDCPKCYECAGNAIAMARVTGSLGGRYDIQDGDGHYAKVARTTLVVTL